MTEKTIQYVSTSLLSCKTFIDWYFLPMVPLAPLTLPVVPLASFTANIVQGSMVANGNQWRQWQNYPPIVPLAEPRMQPLSN